MKKTISLILSVLSFALVNGQMSNESAKFEKLNLKPIKSVFDEQTGEIDPEIQALRVNWNEHFNSGANDAGETALFYLQAKQDVYKLSNNLDDIKITQIVESPSGKYIYFEQYLNDIPVFATNFIVYINKENVVTYALNEFRNTAKYKDIRSIPTVNDDNALKIASEQRAYNYR